MRCRGAGQAQDPRDASLLRPRTRRSAVRGRPRRTGSRRPGTCRLCPPSAVSARLFPGPTTLQKTAADLCRRARAGAPAGQAGAKWAWRPPKAGPVWGRGRGSVALTSLCLWENLPLRQHVRRAGAHWLSSCIFAPPNMFPQAACASPTFSARSHSPGPLENISRMFQDASGERGHKPYVLIRRDSNTNPGASWCSDGSFVQ